MTSQNGASAGTKLFHIIKSNENLFHNQTGRLAQVSSHCSMTTSIPSTNHTSSWLEVRSRVSEISTALKLISSSVVLIADC